MQVFLARRTAGIKLGLQHLLALSAAENRRFHLFSKIRACSAALYTAHTVSMSLHSKATSAQTDIIVSLSCQLQTSQSQFPNWAADVAWHRAQTKKPHFLAGPGAYYLISGTPHTTSGPKLAHIWPAQQTGGADRAEPAPSQGRYVHVGLSFFHYAVTFPSQPLNNV